TNIIISSIFTVLILSMFELIKRIVLKNFSFDFVKERFKIKEFSIISWLIISLGLIVLSFYFSINGAMKFADNTIVVEQQINKELKFKQDSVKSVYQKRINEEESNIQQLKDLNIALSNKIITSNFISAIQSSIDKNIKEIEKYDNNVN